MQLLILCPWTHSHSNLRFRSMYEPAKIPGTYMQFLQDFFSALLARIDFSYPSCHSMIIIRFGKQVCTFSPSFYLCVSQQNCVSDIIRLCAAPKKIILIYQTKLALSWYCSRQSIAWIFQFFNVTCIHGEVNERYGLSTYLNPYQQQQQQQKLSAILWESRKCGRNSP